MKAIQLMISGNLTDALEAAKHASLSALQQSAIDDYGFSNEAARAAACYLKGDISFTEYDNVKSREQDAGRMRTGV